MIFTPFCAVAFVVTFAAGYALGHIKGYDGANGKRNPKTEGAKKRADANAQSFGAAK